MLRVKLHFQSTLEIGKMKVYYWTIFFGLLIFVNATQGLYLTHALAGEVCAHEPTCLQNLPHHLKRFDRKIFLQRPTRSDRFVSIFYQKSTLENRARGNQKTLNWLKMATKSNFRNLKLKSHEEYLIYRTYFIKKNTWFSS